MRHVMRRVFGIISVGFVFGVLTLVTPWGNAATTLKKSGDSGDLAGGLTIGGPGVFSGYGNAPKQVFGAESSATLCLTLIGLHGKTQAQFDMAPDFQVPKGVTSSVCRDNKNSIELNCVGGRKCKAQWRVDTPEGGSEIIQDIIVNAPQGPPGPEGIEGPQGPTGPTGPTGPAGGSSTTTVIRLDCPFNSKCQVNCAAGKSVVGGGGTCGRFGGNEAIKISDFVASVPPGWAVECIDITTGEVGTLQEIHVICIP